MAPRLHLRPLVFIAGVQLLVACSGAAGSAPPVPGRRNRLSFVADRLGVFEDRLDVTVFQRGNVHTHSTASDGDSSPEDVYAWYRDHGYNFLGLSDHNVFIEPARYRHLEQRGFVLIPAEEITINVGRVPVHVNALCHKTRIGGGGRFDSIGDALAWSVRETAAQGGVAVVNHPNHRWAFGASELVHAQGARLLEIWSGNPLVHSLGNATHPSTEVIWQQALDQGWGFAGVAVDDMHRLGAEAGSDLAGPGRGWIYAFANNADAAEICDALRGGRLMASNGVSPSRLTVQGDTISITTRAPAGTVEFLGEGGDVLDSQPVERDRPSVYHLRGGEAYVRARVTEPSGKRAWTQAYRVAYR
jgi:hypothetical protein